jgi:polyphosphate:AMP phosphotransferase
VEFEQTLAADGALILKFWMHLGKAAQKKRLTHLEHDPLRRWRVDRLAWKHWRMYPKFIAAAEQAIRETNRADAPWMIVEGADARYRGLTVGEAVRDAIRGRLAELRTTPKRAPGPEPATAPVAAAKARRGAARRAGVPSLLSSLNMTRTVKPDKAAARIQEEQGRLNLLQRRARASGVSTILVFEGWDAAGKGGAIRRVTAALDARDYQIVPVAAPTYEERAQHYLWRFWRHVPRDGRFTIFDRSWYGRVLVERVEGFAPVADWDRAYGEINAFERQLTDHGMAVAKFWIHVSPAEQLKRFKERARVPYKRYKITDEDWRNRKKMPAYREAVEEMLARCTAPAAPWTVVAGDDKRFARVQILRAVADRVERALD